MKENVLKYVALSLMGAGMALSIYASDAFLTHAKPQDWCGGSTTLSSEPMHKVTRFELPSISEEDSGYISYVYTYSDLVIFSYSNSSTCEVVDFDGSAVWSKTLDENEYEVIEDLPYGVYLVKCPHEFAVLSGDSWGVGLGAWTALDDNSRPLSTRLLSMSPGAGMVLPYDFEQSMTVFAYKPNTHVVIKDVAADTQIWEGDLDSGSYFYHRHDNLITENYPYSVEASEPVSTMTGGGLGYYLPAYNGTFTGRDFMGYVAFVREPADASIVPQDLEIIPWENNTTVTVTDLDNPLDTIWKVFCEKRGEIKGINIPLPNNEGRAIYVHGDKDISAAQIPWASYDPTTSIGFYLAVGVDRGGLGIGTEFYLPLECSGSEYLSRLNVVAYRDNTDVTVTRIPRNGGTESAVWNGTLNKGEHYQFTARSWNAEDFAIYHVVTTKPSVTMANCYDRNGADFFPTVNYLAVGINEEPVALPPGNWRISSSAGPTVLVQYSDFPHGFQAGIFDASGRKVDEIFSAAPSGSLMWGDNMPSGVYFIKPSGKEASPRKVIITR